MNSEARSVRPIRPLFTWIGGLALGILLTGSASAATVQGRILHRGDHPASSVAVRVVSTGHGPSTFAHSGDDGWYYLNGIPAGEYTLEIWITDRNIVRLPVSVHESVTNVPVQTIP